MSFEPRNVDIEQVVQKTSGMLLKETTNTYHQQNKEHRTKAIEIDLSGNIDNLVKKDVEDEGNGEAVYSKSFVAEKLQKLINVDENPVKYKEKSKKKQKLRKSAKDRAVDEKKSHPIPVSVKKSEGNRPLNLTSFPEQVVRVRKRKGVDLSIMIAGSAGTGKTTFINTLFDNILLESEKEFPPTENITIHKFEVAESDFMLRLNLIDTPGFGQFADNRYVWAPLIEHIESQFRSRFLQEEQPDRSKQIDSRISYCLYFISPSGKDLTQLDVTTMQEISKKTNLIPVIAKCDTFDSDGLQAFKVTIRRILQDNNIQVCNFIKNQDLKKKMSHLMPFAIIGSTSYCKNADGKLVRGRLYSWGVAEVENEEHCDFNALRGILLDTNMEDLVESVEHYYEKFRSDTMMNHLSLALEKKLITGPQFEKINHSGLQRYLAFRKLLYRDLRESFQENNAILISKQELLKDKFHKRISYHEKRFKEWKNALIEKKEALNNEIKELNDRADNLQSSIDHLSEIYEENATSRE